MFKDVYAGRRVFITGHTGFKGAWLSAWLYSLGAELMGYSHDIPTSPSLFSELKLEKHLQDVRGDVRNLQNLTQYMQEFKPDIVFHLAAQALVQTSYAQPVQTFETNALGTLNVLEAVRQTPSVQALVCITSDKCYQNNEWVYGYREDDALGGVDPYSASKACAEIIAKAYIQSYFSQKNTAACATVRAGNVIGGGDFAKDRIVPDCAKAYAKGEAVHIRNPHATRPWQHVLEPLSGYLWLGAKLLLQEHSPFDLRGQAYNFGPAAQTNATVQQVVESLVKLWPGFSSTMQNDMPITQHECTLLKLCCDKALAHLHWLPVYDFTQCIEATAAWYYAFYGKRVNMYDFTMEQIKSYTEIAAQREYAWARQ